MENHKSEKKAVDSRRKKRKERVRLEFCWLEIIRKKLFAFWRKGRADCGASKMVSVTPRTNSYGAKTFHFWFLLFSWLLKLDVEWFSVKKQPIILSGAVLWKQCLSHTGGLFEFRLHKTNKKLKQTWREPEWMEWKRTFRNEYIKEGLQLCFQETSITPTCCNRIFPEAIVNSPGKVPKRPTSKVPWSPSGVYLTCILAMLLVNKSGLSLIVLTKAQISRTFPPRLLASCGLHTKL